MRPLARFAASLLPRSSRRCPRARTARVLRCEPAAVLAAALAATAPASAPPVASPLATGSWSSAAPLAAARQEVAVAELGGKVYVIGGLAGIQTLASVEVYDPVQNAWSSAAPLPAARHHAAAAVAGGTLYVIGGFASVLFDAVDTVFAYDPQSNQWSPRAPLPTARGGLAAAVIGGRIYAAGGSPDARERDFAVYDPAQDAWTPLPAMPTPRNHLAAAAAGGRFFALGGRGGLAGITNVTGAVEAFDPGPGTWSPVTPLPTPRGGIAAAAARGCVYVFGGEGNAASALGTFAENERLDPYTGLWTPEAGMPTPRHGIGAATLGDRISIPGGGTVQGFSTSVVHEIFTAEADCAPADADGDGVPDASDVCPSAPDPGQEDRGGVGAGSASDGIGDACQCGDVSGDGRVTIADSTLVARSLLAPPTATLARPELCDADASPGCGLADAVTIRRALLSPPTAAIGRACVGAPAAPH
jgi:N-acetylneuraminic acid mutarotase